MPITRRWSRVQSQILVWCGDERIEIPYDGSLIAVPPVNEVAKIGIRSPYRLASATTKAGVPLPGTVLVEDVIVQNEDGGWKKIFDVSDLCAYLERDEPELFARGFQIVSDPEDVKPVQAECRPAYEASVDQRARDILALELTRRKKFEDAGQPVLPGTNEKDVMWAVRHQRLRASQRRSGVADFSTNDIYNALAGDFEPTDAQVAPPPEPEEITRESSRISAASLIDEADELGMKLSPSDLKGIIRGDEDVVNMIAERVKLRREASTVAQ